MTSLPGVIEFNARFSVRSIKRKQSCEADKKDNKNTVWDKTHTFVVAVLPTTGVVERNVTVAAH
jgi:hypothetical protein